MYENIWAFGSGGGGTWNPPFGGGPSYGGGAGGNAPWWVDAGIYIANETGAFDWLGETLFGQSGGGGGGYTNTDGTYVPTTGSGMPLDYVSSLLDDDLVAGTGVSRQRALQSYEENPDVMNRFLDWMKTLGAVGSLVQRLATGSIFEWPIIIQDLILLFFHNQPRAVEIGPVVVREANANAGTVPVVGGGLPSVLAQYAPPVLKAEPVIRVKSRKGYVVVTDPQSGNKILMKKALAVSAGLHKSRKRAPITGKEWDNMKKADRMKKKLSKMSKDMGCNTARRRR